MRRARAGSRHLACLAGIVATWSALAGCEPAGAAAAAAPDALVQERHDGFWWLHTGEQSAAVACFGATIDTPQGRFRPWSLVVHLPGSEEPLSCTQGLLPLDGAHPILSQGASFLVELRPAEGLAWVDVVDETRLAVNAQGLY